MRTVDWGAKIALARAAVLTKMPYLGETIYGFIPHPTDNPEVKGTLGVTPGMVLYFDPDWLSQLEDDKLGAALIHESGHVDRKHHERFLEHCSVIERDGMIAAEDQDKAHLFNVGGDLSINVNIRDSGWVLPHGFFPKDPQFNFPEGLTAEAYFDLLQKLQKKQQKQQGGTSKGKDQHGDHQGQPGGGMPGVGRGRCGGIAGNPISKELEEELDKKFGRSKLEVDQIVSNTIEAIQQHIAEHGRGSVPGYFSEIIEEMKERSLVRWQDQLKHILRKLTGRLEAGGHDYSLTRPSKSAYARGMIRPGMVSYQPEISFILDTSGSMGQKQILAALREACGVFQTVGIESAWFLQADTTVAIPPNKIRLRDLKRDVKIHGRGGTDFVAALEAAGKLRPRPDVVMYLTDGDGGAPDEPPKGFEVVWVVVKSHFNKRPAPWGHVVFVPSAK